MTQTAGTSNSCSNKALCGYLSSFKPLFHGVEKIRAANKSQIMPNIGFRCLKSDLNIDMAPFLCLRGSVETFYFHKDWSLKYSKNFVSLSLLGLEVECNVLQPVHRFHQ